MKPATLLICILISSVSYGQHLSTRQLIKLWQAADSSQTTKAERSYADLKIHKNHKRFNERLLELYTYLKHHDNQRLLIRTWMYEILGKAEFKIPHTSTDNTHLQKALKMAGLLEDDQLLSELFSLYARFSSAKDNSYYTLRSLEMQEKIGMEHFPLFYLRLINFSISMYHVGEYRSSIQYGKKALELLQNKTDEDAQQRRILQLDYIGASYKELKMQDSIQYYYSQIHYYATSFQGDSVFAQIWLGIADGGLGYKLLLEKKYEAAKPYLKSNLRSSIKHKQFQDAAIAMDALAQINFAQKDFKRALEDWRMAYEWFGNNLHGKMRVSEYLGDLFKMRNDFDSASYYYKANSQYKIQHNQFHNQQRAAALQSRIEFDKMDTALQVAKKDILEEKNIRMFLLSGLTLLSVIALLIYNRHRIKTRFLIEQANLKQAITQLEIKQAREQIRVFTEKIKQSEALIEQLKSSPPTDNQMASSPEARLLEYTLVTNESWDKFRLEFIKAYPDFYISLQQIAGQLTPAEERLVALIHLQLNNAQIANSLGIAKDSVSRSKRRLKSRFNLSEEQTIETFLMQFHPAV